LNQEAAIPVEEAIEQRAPLKRFRPYSDYRDSGIEWLGNVPREWATKRLRFVAKINPVKSELRGLGPEEDVSFVPMESVCEYGGLVLDQTKPLESVYQGYTYFRNGDIVVAKITPCFENGKGSIAANLTNDVAFGTTELHVLRAQVELDPSFLFYITISQPFRKLGTGEMFGAGGQKRVPDDFLRDFRTPIPPLLEQRTIASFLRREITRLDSLLAGLPPDSVGDGLLTRLVTLLQEYRSTLIFAAVTGKIDVRGFETGDAPCQ
jgi:type I restriction enzyme, S subunit